MKFTICARVPLILVHVCKGVTDCVAHACLSRPKFSWYLILFGLLEHAVTCKTLPHISLARDVWSFLSSVSFHVVAFRYTGNVTTQISRCATHYILYNSSFYGIRHGSSCWTKQIDDSGRRSGPDTDSSGKTTMPGILRLIT